MYTSANRSSGPEAPWTDPPWIGARSGWHLWRRPPAGGWQLRRRCWRGRLSSGRRCSTAHRWMAGSGAPWLAAPGPLDTNTLCGAGARPRSGRWRHPRCWTWTRTALPAGGSRHATRSLDGLPFSGTTVMDDRHGSVEAGLGPKRRPKSGLSRA